MPRTSHPVTSFPIVHPGIPVHFDPPCLNIYCGGVISLRDFKLGGVIQKSYGFSFVGPVFMETCLTFEPKVFVKFTLVLENNFFPMLHILFSPLMEPVIPWIKSARF